jgi:cell division protein FtsQ
MSPRRVDSIAPDRASSGNELSAHGARWRRWQRLGVVVLGAAAVAAPWWGPPMLSHLAFFRVRRVEVEGARYTAPRDILRQLHVDTAVSVWTDVDSLARRVAHLPEVRSAAIRRKLPGTLVVTVTERVPVALVPTPQGLQPYDETGLPLPIDPSRSRVDAPIVARRDTATFRLLGTLRRQAPELYQRVNAVRRVGDEVDLTLTSFLIRAMTDVTVRRLEDVEPVVRDLANRRLTVAELDLRYRDQVIARLK